MRTEDAYEVALGRLMKAHPDWDWRRTILEIHPTVQDLREAHGDVQLAIARKIAALLDAEDA